MGAGRGLKASRAIIVKITFLISVPGIKL